jgi:hypothetical protein
MEATHRVMAAKLTRLIHKIAIQLHLVAESCTICNSRSRQPVQKLLDRPLYILIFVGHFSVYEITVSQLHGLEALDRSMIVINELKRLWKGIFLEGLRKTTKISARIAGFQAEKQTQHLQTSKQKC